MKNQLPVDIIIGMFIDTHQAMRKILRQKGPANRDFNEQHVLMLLMSEQDRPRSVASIARETKLPRSNCTRAVQFLERRRAIRHTTRGWVLHPKFLARIDSKQFRDWVAPTMKAAKQLRRR